MLVVICTRFYLCSKSNPLLFVGKSRGEELITAGKYKRVINSPGMRRHARTCHEWQEAALCMRWCKKSRQRVMICPSTSYH